MTFVPANIRSNFKLSVPPVLKGYFSLIKGGEICINPFPNKPWFLHYKSFENTVGKGEIVHNEQFLLFPQCFLPFRRTFYHFHQIGNCRLQSLSVLKSLKFVVWDRVKIVFINPFPNRPWFLRAGNQHFLLFSVFSTQLKRSIIILATLNLSSANAFNLVMSKIVSFGKGLKG